MKIANKAKAVAATVAAAAASYAPVFADANPGQYISGEGGDLIGTVKNIIQVALGLVGLIAVIMLIYGGVQYTTSAGDAGKVKKAKDTILYGIIGIIVCILAFAIVNFVVGNIK